MKKKGMAGAGLVGVTLGALGCGEPAQPEAVDARQLFPPRSQTADSLKGESWRKYLKATALHAAWVPPPLSPWRPYYKPTLVAAVSIVESAAAPYPGAHVDQTELLANQLVQQVGPARAAVFVDLPGEESVAWSAVLAQSGFEPVATFNNWPHQHGLLRLERALGALLYYAGEVEASRKLSAFRPVFALEGNRLSVLGVRPGADTFDNRYFHSASDFPSATVLKAQAIDRVYYVSPHARQGPGGEADDLNAYFASLAEAGLQFTYVGILDGRVSLVEVKPVVRQTVFTAPAVAAYSSSSPYGRSYSHYHYFWSSSRSTWGGGYSSYSSGSYSSGSYSSFSS